MKSFKNFDLGLLFIRIGLGVMLGMHGAAKIISGIGGVKGLLLKASLPEFMAYFVYLGEVIAPLMLIFGVFSRAASVLVLGTSAVILYVAHPNLIELNSHGAFKAEILYLYIAMALCVLSSGSGKYAIKAD